MLRLLRSNQPIAFATIPVTALILMVVAVLLDTSSTGLHPSPSWLFASLPKVDSVWISGLFIAFNGVLFNRLFVRHEIILHRNSLAGWWYVLIASSQFLVASFSPILLAHTFTILGLNEALKVYRENDGANRYFNAGFLLGCATICSGPFAILGLSLIGSVLYTRAANWRELSLPVIGFLLPFVQFLGILWLLDLPFDTLQFGSSDSTLFSWGMEEIFYLAVLFLAVALGFFFMLGTFGSSSNKSKNSKAVLIIFSVAMVIVAGLLSSYSIRLSLQVLPLVMAWFIPWPFIDAGKRWKNILFPLLVLVTLAPFAMRLFA